jgi:WD40 repeat protein
VPSNFQRLKSGDPWLVSEPTARAIIEVAEHWDRRARDAGDSDPPTYAFEGQIVQVRNDSGSAMPRFSVASFDSALITPANNLAEFQNYPRFSAKTPAVPKDSGRFSILVEPLAAGAIGLALVSGVTAVQIYLNPGDSAPAFADAVDGQIAYLKAAAFGAQVLYCDPAPTSAGPVWALVRIPAGSASLTACELYDDFTPGATDKYVWTLNSDYSRNTSAGHATVKVSDEVLGDVRAYGSNHTGWSSTRGAMGMYVAGTDGKNQIVAIRRLAKMIMVTSPSGSNTAAGATFTVTSCTVLDDGQNPCSESASITIHNWNQQLCKSVANVVCLANGDGTWRVIDADCPPSGGCT